MTDVKIPRVIRKYIDSLDDDGRDRVISGPLGKVVTTTDHGERCVMQLGENTTACAYPVLERGIELCGNAYDRFTRNGKDQRAIAAIKAYAARRNRVELPEASCLIAVGPSMETSRRSAE